MSNPQDIIERVKKLQKAKHSGSASLGDSACGTCYQFCCQCELCDCCSSSLYLFPKLAQALLIAVEALEDIQGTDAGAIPGPRLHAAETLSRIRSL